MRWARFDNGGTPTYGVVEGDVIIPVRGSPFEAWERTMTKRKLSDVKLMRSEERRVGKECRSRRWPHLPSRRRHTRCLSDWSSDVCSSDLSSSPCAAHRSRRGKGR